MKCKFFRPSGILVMIVSAWLFFLAATPADAQSTDQNNPTPITADEIKGEIRARDIGDSRLTTHYYLFRGDQGDVFINVVTSNINGAIDVFTKIGLRPRTKITLFADSRENETGRVLYMRESGLLILRIQGRSPNDDPGNYQLKFAGAFSPVSGLEEKDLGPRVQNVEGSVRVNSVGTILPQPKSTRAEPEQASARQPVSEEGLSEEEDKVEIPVSSRPVAEEIVNTDSDKIPEASKGVRPLLDSDDDDPVLSKETPVKKGVELGVADTEEASAPEKEVTVEINGKRPSPSAVVTISREPEPDRETTLEEKLANVYLRISLKSGTVFTRSMSEVLSVNVIKGALTVVTTDGQIQEFSILDVLRMTIE